MSEAEPGAMTVAVGGLADPRIPNVFVWPTKGEAASVEILAALGKPAPAEEMDKKATEAPQAAVKRQSHGKRGRPKGSKNRHRQDVTVSSSLRFVQETIKRLLELIGKHFKVMYFVYDGAFGHNDALQMVRQAG